jgi:hypothetical protein
MCTGDLISPTIDENNPRIKTLVLTCMLWEHREVEPNFELVRVVGMVMDEEKLWRQQQPNNPHHVIHTEHRCCHDLLRILQL